MSTKTKSRGRPKKAKARIEPPVVDLLGELDGRGNEMPAKKQRLVESHAAAHQPDERDLDALIGETVQARVARAAEWRDVSGRISQAKASARNNFYGSAEVAARYANADGVRAFITPSGARAGGGEALSRSANAEQSRSLIDDMIAVSNNSVAQKSRARPGVLGALADTSRVVTIDDFVARVLGIGSLSSPASELFEQPFQLDGLSASEPNPDWQRLEQERAALLERREALVLEQRSFSTYRGFVAETSTIAKDREREALRMQLMEFAPIDSVELLKPASEVRALNDRWRELLGRTLGAVYNEYRDRTAAALADVHGAAIDGDDALNLSALYMQYVVAPPLEEYMAQLRAATYEDMPLTRETLHEYFERFVEIALAATLRDRDTNGEEALRRLRERTERAPARNVAEALEDEAQRWRRTIAGDDDSDDEPLFDDAGLGAARTQTPAQREASIVAAYLRQALHIYANPLYMLWFDAWMTRKRADPTADVDDASAQTLRVSVQAMIDGREHAHNERNRHRPVALPRYEPMPEQQVAREYERMLHDRIALQRAEKIVEQDDDSALKKAIAYALAGSAASTHDAGAITLPVELLLYPRADRIDLLDEAVAEIHDEIEAANQAALRGEDDAAREQIEAARDAAQADLDAREARLHDELLYYAPRVNDVDVVGPRSTSKNDFTPYDLSYPLDATTTRRQQHGLARTVSLLEQRYDADAIHERADEFRSLLSYGYAEQLIEREVMRIDYTLAELTRPERPTALRLTRPLSSTRPFELNVELKLRDELALVEQSPNAALIDQRIVDARARLEATRWRVTWFFKARYGAADEVVLESKVLPAGVRRASLVRPALPDSAAAGLYWAVFEPDDDAEAKVRSRFTASVRIVAQCRRSGRAFEVGSEQHGEISWQEWPRDALTREVSEEWLVLITRGDEALRELIRQRAANVRIAHSAPDGDLFLPPWGTDDEQNLLKTFGALDASAFTLNGIYARIVERIGGLLKRELRTSFEAGRVPRDAMSYVNATPMTLFAKIVDTNAGAPDSTVYDDFVHAIQLNAAQRSSTGAWSDKTIGGGSTLLDDRVDVMRFDNAPSVAELRERMLSVDSKLFDPEALPMSAVRRLTAGFARGVGELPLATLLLAAYTPVIWLNLTWRERRFINTMHTRFENFAHDYRRAERRSLYYGQVMRDQPWCTHARRPLSYDHNRAMPLDVVRRPVASQSVPAIDAIEDEIDRRLAGMTASAIKAQFGRRQFAIGDRETELGYRGDTGNAVDSAAAVHERHTADTFCVDVELRREYDALIERQLVRTGLLVAEQHMSLTQPGGVTSAESTRSQYPVTVLRRPAAGDGARETIGSNAATRTTWLGACSHRTDQPDIYSIIIDERRGAAIEQRGSVPLNKGYDFDGLHETIVATVRQYTGVIQGTNTDGMNDEARDRVREKLAQRLRDLELVYNFLAFVAHPLGAPRILLAAEIVALLDDRAHLFQRIGNAAARTGAALL